MVNGFPSALNRQEIFKAGHFRYFLIFSIIKNDFCIFYQVNLTGSGLFK